ncbi:MAG: HNH endonuclease [Gammaproteobacteria bacterium]|nr:HNH endonuclease [Gammaproteobacteria bacterium]
MKPSTIFISDNLPVLRGIEDASVDLVYLDPPYNSNKSWVAFDDDGNVSAHFKDTWTLADIDIAWWGRLASKKNAKLYSVLRTVQDLDGSRNGKNISYCVYMSIRLLEMHRILKPSGALVLQCDDVMGPHLRFVLDAIFGPKNMVNVVAWNRKPKGVGNIAKKQLPRSFDYIYYYRKSAKHKFRPQYREYDDLSNYRFEDEKGKYYAVGMAKNGSGMLYEFEGVTREWSCTEAKMRELHAQGLLVQLKEGGLFYKKNYLSDAKGVLVGNFWDDIDAAEPLKGVDYPTRKPLELLKRIISMTTDRDDLVLDPFCGCATTCVAAEVLGREWVGIDLSSEAVVLVAKRMKVQLPGDMLSPKINQRTRAPKPIHSISSKEELKNRMYGECEGECIGCGAWKPHSDMDVDHIIPRKTGDHEIEFDENKQLLCRTCNNRKSNRSMKKLMEANLRDGIISKKYYDKVMKSREWPE